MAQVLFAKASAIPYLEGLINALSSSVTQQLNANAALQTPSYANRAAAVTGAQALTSSVNLILVREGLFLVLRSRTAFAVDPLYGTETASRWGVLLSIEAPRIWPTTTTDISTLTPPDATDQISIGHNGGYTLWRRLSGAPGTVNPAIHAQTVDGRWWQLVEDTAGLRATVASAISLVANSAFPPFAITAGSSTANAIVGTVPYGNGTSFVAGNRLSLTPLAANTGAVTLNNVQVRDEAGQFLTGGELVPGRMVLLERDASQNFFRIVGGGLSRADVQALIAPVSARVTLLETAATAPFETIVGETDRAVMTDAAGNAIIVWKPGVTGGFDLHVADSFVDRLADRLGTGGGGEPLPTPGLSTTEIQLVGVNGQSLSVGGDFTPQTFPASITTRAQMLEQIRPGAALFLEGTIRADRNASTGAIIPIVSLDMPRSQGYDESVPATGFGQAQPSVTGVTAAFPLANILNEYRRDLNLPQVPIATQCHGVSGQLIENIDNDPATGDPGYLTIWNNLRYWHAQARAVALATGRRVSVPWHYWVHGTSAAGYAQGSYLAQLWNYVQDMQELMLTLGLEGPARMLVSQAGGNTRIDNAGNQWHVVDEQLQFCEEGGGILTTPEYAYEVFDNNVHPDAHNLTQIAEVAARAAAETEAGRPWTIHRPKVQLMGSTMILNFDSLRPGEYLKRHDPARYGGQGIDQYLGFQPVGTTFTDMTMRGQTIAFTCAAPPTGLRYAYQRQDVRAFANNRYNAHRGLLRTSDEWRSKMLTDTMLYRWIPSFKIAF